MTTDQINFYEKKCWLLVLFCFPSFNEIFYTMNGMEWRNVFKENAPVRQKSHKNKNLGVLLSIYPYI